MFDPVLGHTELQLKQMRSHLRMVGQILDDYELEITEKEAQGLRDSADRMTQTLDTLIQSTSEDIEISFLNRKLKQELG